MIDIYVLDANFQILSIVDDFSSLQWRENYCEPGSVELHCDAKYAETLREGAYLYRKDSEYTAMIEEFGWDGQAVYVKGRFLEALLETRCVNDYIIFSGNAEQVMRDIVERYCVADPERRIPRLEIGEARGLGSHITVQRMGDTVLDTLLAIMAEQELSIRLRYDFDADKLVFEVFQGLDRTQEQDENAWAVFSEQWDNVLSENYVHNTDYRNFAYVAGVGEGDDRRMVIVDKTSGEPLAAAGKAQRRELFVDASDIYTDEYMTPAEYDDLLRERGAQMLSEYAGVDCAACEIDTTAPVSYALGDICSYVNGRLGFTAQGRITEIVDILESGGAQRRISLGRDQLNIKQYMRREKRR